MSASPVSSSGGDKPSSDQIHFKFCRECSNLLYPKEDRVQNRLMFTCRTCHVSEPATSPCVYQNNLNTQVGETAGVTQDVGSDPTVGDPEFCLHCGEELACAQCGVLASGGALSDYHSSSDYDDDSREDLPRSNKLCPSCGENEAVFFQSQQRSAETGMKLYYVCCTCGNVFT